MKNATAIFGGSFDPLTNAHLGVIESLSERFGRVIVVPSHVSPFKQDANAVSDEMRLRILDECCSHLKNVEVSRFETDNDGVSYTYKTVAHYKKDCEKLYFVVGTDMIDGLDRWKNIQSLNDNAIFYVIPRPYFEIDNKKLDELKRLGFRFELADFVGQEGSSSLLKVARALGKEEEVVPRQVARLIRENGLYTDYEYVTQRFSEFGMKQSRIDHTYRATKMAILLAKTYGADIVKTVKATLMHDIGKYVTPQMLAARGIECDENATRCESAVAHCYTSRAIAEHVLGETDEEILLAIENHTTARAGMGVIEKIVFVADYIEEGRDFEGASVARRQAFKSLDGAVRLVLEQTVAYLSKNGRIIDPRTLIALDYYKSAK